MTTFAPRFARSIAVARPTPTADPVTIAVLPRTSIGLLLSLSIVARAFQPASATRLVRSILPADGV
jgi:hypothetical protein